MEFLDTGKPEYRYTGLYDGQYVEDQHLVSQYIFKNSAGATSQWVEDASFIRLKTITLAYYLDQKSCKKIGFSKARFYVSGTNLVTLTKYTGYDPEVAAFTYSDAVVGVDLSAYPPAKMLTFGVDFTFDNNIKFKNMKKRQMNILNLGLLSALILMLLPRCVKLEEKPLDFTNPDNFYKSVSQIESAFASSLQRLFSPWSAYGYTYYNFQDDDQYDYGELVIEDNHASDLWANHYQSIADINPAIKALNEDRLGSLVEQDVKDELMAQAKFVRAFNYFSLVRLWGPVPLITENTDLTPEIIGPPQVARSPIIDVYALIESDLLFAVDKLPEVWPPEQKGRPSKDAARALLAKVYITMATNPMNDATQYVKARDMAKQVIDAGNHSLEHNVEDVFKLENAYGPEMIWSFNCSPDDPMTEPQIWLPGSMADGWGDIHPDVKWAAKYPDQPRRECLFTA